MKQVLNINALLVSLAASLLLSVVSPGESIAAAEENRSEAGTTEPDKGPHRGRLLTRDGFALEITIFEQGIPPEFHVYAYLDGRPLEPSGVELQIELARLGGQIDRHDFSAQGDYLRGNNVVTEPHSFDVAVSAKYQGKTWRWAYENYEGRTVIDANMAREAGIETEIADPATLHETASLTGRVQTDPNRLSRVRPRYPGVVQSVNHNLGDTISAGDVLATIQSDESLQNYTLRAPIGGLIIYRDIQVGESTGDKLLFTVADLSQVWVELDVFSSDLSRIRAGQQVTVETFDGYQAQGTIDWVSPLAAHASQSVRARVPMNNPQGRLRPGQFVRGKVAVAEHEVMLAVKKTAIQSFRDFQVVFARFGQTYEVRMLETGRSDSDWVEVLSGLEPGTEYVTNNSYLVKADIEKSGASHDH